MNDVKDLLHSREPGVDESAIKEAEEKLGAAFPEQYKELFKLCNHPEIGEWTLYPIKDRGNLKKTWDDIVRQNTEVRYDYMAEDLIAIGDDGTGDQLCFKVTNGVMGNTIYLWYHEDAELEEYATNLKEFIILISEEDDDEDYEEE
ncbi:SMI1/KNR4 family protein [Jeotgalibacillus proteolyticus]|uniref:Cell wall assembly protein n=1 Tax=Jeotgalibacillus proteolyticus TaxID=2082395 RepID=A0A2S5G789_9BACL|nr:SMI1/KNR4 family protein [Jeotgalibacillus proteolyticus]PPA68840.1 cell wall assembly protein [Jeotgalibacillus proteolyticus]